MISVAIVDDDKEVRDGIAVLINGTEGYRCVGAFANAEEALERIPGSPIDVVLMDINMPQISGIECVTKLKLREPRLQIMMLTSFEDDEKIFQSLVAGASGYLLKKTPPAKLLEAIEEVHHGGSPMSNQIARKVVETFQRSGPPAGETVGLTAREQEILSHLAKGYRYKEIADTLFISVETVRTHLRNIYDKLHVRSRTEAVLKYLNKQ
ncbi:MAG TPA: response regulator transcription factor [Bacteroidota bacterium]|nr:response regulator transcription factor [Bacteroidota bacterium]